MKNHLAEACFRTAAARAEIALKYQRWLFEAEQAGPERANPHSPRNIEALREDVRNWTRESVSYFRRGLQALAGGR